MLHINFYPKNWHYCNRRGLVTGVSNHSPLCYSKVRAFSQIATVLLFFQAAIKQHIYTKIAMLAILTNWKSTAKTNTLNFCPEYKLVANNYGTGEIPSKTLSNMSIFVGVQTIIVAK